MFFFFNESKSSIKSSLKLLTFPCRFEFSVALCFLRERHVLFEMRLHSTESLSSKEFRVSSKMSLVMLSFIASFANTNTSSLPHLLFWRFNVSTDAIINTSIFLSSFIFSVSSFAQLISIIICLLIK